MMTHGDPKVRAPRFPKYQSENGVRIESTSIHIEAFQFQSGYEKLVNDQENL